METLYELEGPSIHFTPLQSFPTQALPLTICNLLSHLSQSLPLSPLNHPMQSKEASDMITNQTPGATPPASSSKPEDASDRISNALPPADSSSGSTPAMTTPGEEEKNQAIKDDLFRKVMGSKWEEVVKIYRQSKEIVQTAKITRSNETALHVAISDSRIDVVKELVEIIDGDVIREMTNDRKENPLHLAASLGQAETCKVLVGKVIELIGERNEDGVGKAIKLIGERNEDGETPLFLAALHGKKGAFFALHPKCPKGHHIKHDIVHCKRNDGNSILHVSIQGEYFGNHPSYLSYSLNKLCTSLLRFSVRNV